MSNKDSIERVDEMDLSHARERQVAALLDECFPETFEGRSYYKQLPKGRLLLERDGKVAGHLGFEHRVIRVGHSVIKIVGIVDLCVRSGDRHQGRGTELLQQVEQVARKAEADHLVLFADQVDLYFAAGYHPVEPATVTWLAIDERASHGMLTRDYTGTLLTKSVSGQVFPSGEIDLLGYLF